MIKRISIILTLCLICLLTVNPVFAADDASESISAPDKSETLYGIGSVSKVFTAAAVMKLVDDGKINLDEPLTAYISEFKMADERYTQITPRMLLNHSSGLMGTTGNNAWLLGDNDTYNHDHFLEFLSRQTLKHDPGESSIYCNDGLILAEILVERVSGIGFTEFIEKNFSQLLGLKNIKTPQSDFDRDLLADIYMGNNKLKSENVNLIGTGGIYATMEDLCRYATIFMDSADGSILSKESVNEMAKNQHKNEMVSEETEMIRYGLGWDSVETYPFSQYGIKALSKGGDTIMYHTNLTVLPEYNLAVAVSASGTDSKAQLIAQEIILEVLKEEGLIPENTAVVLPEQNLERAKVPESIKAYAGIYDAGMVGLMNIEFTQDSLILTPILVKNERRQEYIYNTDGEFVSTNNDYLTIDSIKEGSRGVTALTFTDDGYIVMQTYEYSPGLSVSAMALPLAEKLAENPVSDAAQTAWTARNDKEYLLVNEKYTSILYTDRSITKILTDERIRGYVGHGIYKGGGNSFSTVKIADETTALGFQDIPTMMGRDTVNLSVVNENSIEYLYVNNYRYIDAATAKKFSEIGETVVVGSDTVWVDIDGDTVGRSVYIDTPENGAWFAYDDKMNCIATSLEKYPRNTIILPENGRLAFAGENGAKFILK